MLAVRHDDDDYDSNILTPLCMCVFVNVISIYFTLIKS